MIFLSFDAFVVITDLSSHDWPEFKLVTAHVLIGTYRINHYSHTHTHTQGPEEPPP